MKGTATLLGVLFLNAVGAHAAQVASIDGVVLPVSNLERSVVFYTNVLGFKKVSELPTGLPELERLYAQRPVQARTARLSLGDFTLELRQYILPDIRIRSDTRPKDQWFQSIAIAARDKEKAHAVLSKYDFKDPDGHPLELVSSPEKKGDLFSGIDHITLVTAASNFGLMFYRDFLGLKVAGEDDDADSRVHAVDLIAASGPGIKLLTYPAPNDGRQGDSPSGAIDLSLPETVMAVADLDQTVTFLKERQIPVSPAASVGKPLLGFSKGALARDFDGHVLLLIQK